MKIRQLAPLTSIVSFMFTVMTAPVMAEGFYGVGEVTSTKHSLDSDYFDNALNSAGATGLSSSASSNSNQWRLQGGYRFNDNVALEAGYIDVGEAKYKADFNGGSTKGSLKAGGLDAAGVLSLPLNENFSVFAKAGILAAKVKSHISANAPLALTDNNSSVNQVRPLLGVGAVYKISDQWDVRADYDQVSNLGKSSSTGTMDAKMMSLGVVYKF